MIDPPTARILDLLFTAQERVRHADRAIHEATEALLDASAPHLTTEQLDTMWENIKAKLAEAAPDVSDDGQTFCVDESLTHAVAFEGHPASLLDEPPSRPVLNSVLAITDNDPAVN